MREAFGRLGRYSLLKGVSLFLMVVVALYLTVFIANWGGELDKIRRAQIKYDVTVGVSMAFADQGLTQEQLQVIIDDAVATQYRRFGLDRPFIIRSFYYLRDAVTLNLGRAEMMTSDYGSRQVTDILKDRVPRTLLLIATSELILFFLALLIALFLSRRYGGWLDRVIVGLAPTSAAPGWFYGIFLILIFAAVLGVLPYGRMVQIGVPKGTWEYFFSVLKHMVLPVSAIIIGAIFSSIYSWRTFFLIYSSEDYVELARAKGLSSQAIERRYVLRPTLPPIVTSFLLMIITVWMGMIILESVFNWPGLGQTFYEAMQRFDTPVIVGIVVIYGYLLAATVFMLDFIYALLDPRVRVGPGGSR